MKVTDEIMEALGFIKDKSYGGKLRYYNFDSKYELYFPAEGKDVPTLEEILEIFKGIWIEQGKKDIKRQLRKILEENK